LNAASQAPKTGHFSHIDQTVIAALYAPASSILDALKIVRRSTVIRWRRVGLVAYWRRESRA